MDAKILFVLIGLLFRWLPLILGARTKVMANFTKLECVNQWPELLQINYHISGIPGNTSSIYADLTFSEDLTNVNGIYQVAVEHDHKYVNYTTLDIDHCTALHSILSQSLGQFISVAIRRVSNLPLSCPLKKNTKYVLNGVTIDPKVIPAYMPEVKFRTHATYFYNKREFLHCLCFGRVVRK